jgi:quinoprotein glucose dehydrogenase
LGLAFHPKFKENGQVFVYYTTSDTPHTSVVSRFSANKDRTEVDPASEVELLRIPQPFWNHNGGTIVFGPDGYLYIALGDGGARDDPHGNGQNLNTWLGDILRIDVDRGEAGKPYAIPSDNPYVGRSDAKPEIYASGLRNVWRVSFDRKTGQGWVADVGQDIWEEIDLLEKGGNYGWNRRESKHKFGQNPAEASPEFIEPIFEYHHDLGKSITGGHVYRGKLVPELDGWYLYADYVGGQVWALKYDFHRKQVVANRPIGIAVPVMSFGEAEDGEVYYMTTQGWLHRFVPAAKSASR